MCVLLAVFAFATTAVAAPRTWTISGGTFTGGGTFSGSFVYDADTDTYSSISISTTAGPGFAGATYAFTRPGNSSTQLSVVTAGAGDLTDTTFVMLTFESALTNAGGTINLVLPTMEDVCADAACSSSRELSRDAATGTVTSAATYSVTYSGNGNTGGSVPTDFGVYAAGATVTVRANSGSLVKAGHVFAAWNTWASGGGTDYAASGTATLVMPNADLTLYARWPRVNFDGPSPSGSGMIAARLTSGDTGCGFLTPRYIPVQGDPDSPPPGTAPAGVTFPYGLFHFTVNNCTTLGSTVTISLIYPQPLPPGIQQWKYGRTAANPVPHWYTIPATVSGNTVTFSLTDGGLGDDDLAVNGTIVDPTGSGVSPTVPIMSGWAIALLAAVLLTLGAWRVRQTWA